jgi:hypothetical protein
LVWRRRASPRATRAPIWVENLNPNFGNPNMTDPVDIYIPAAAGFLCIRLGHIAELENI